MTNSNKYQHLQKLLTDNDIILMEAAIVERLRRSESIDLHPSLVHAPLIYDSNGREALKEIYNSYIRIARNNNIPIIICTPTWRANQERVIDAGIDPKINIDSAKLLIELREKLDGFTDKVIIGGVVGCKNDCYKPEEGLTIEKAEKFHEWQITQLVQGGVDFLIAETLPMVDEAVGIAKVMEKSGLPYILSFVISRDGNILDGTPLSEAIFRIDDFTSIQPAGYMVMPGDYKVVMSCGDQKDSTMIRVSFDPRVELDIKALEANEKMYNELSRKAQALSKATSRLQESRAILTRISDQVKGKDDPDLIEVGEKTGAVQDSPIPEKLMSTFKGILSTQVLKVLKSMT